MSINLQGVFLRKYHGSAEFTALITMMVGAFLMLKIMEEYDYDGNFTIYFQIKR